MKFHVNPKDQTRKCRALIKCRYASDHHFDSAKQAQDFIEQKNLEQNSNNIIATLKKTSQNLNNDSGKLLKNKNSQTIPNDTVIQNEDGTYEVVCYDNSMKGNLTHKFGDFIKDLETAERLHKADPHKNYQLGDCGVLAGELWNRNEFVEDYFVFKTEDDPDFGTHHFVRLTDGTYADSLGIWSEEKFLSTWKEIDPTAHFGTFDLDDEPEHKDPNINISNQDLYNTIDSIIRDHMSRSK